MHEQDKKIHHIHYFYGTACVQPYAQRLMQQPSFVHVDNAEHFWGYELYQFALLFDRLTSVCTDGARGFEQKSYFSGLGYIT